MPVQKRKMADGFEISHNYWLFSNDIMAVRGLNVQDFFLFSTSARQEEMWGMNQV